MDPREHWERLYRTRRLDELSWTQSACDRSLDFIRRTGVPLDAPILDVGGGASILVDRLLELGYTDLTVLDVSAAALAVARERLGEAARRVTWLERNVLAGPLPRCAVWHDRAVFHFFTEPGDRHRYAELLTASLQDGGFLVVSAFAKDGPSRCSGLEVRRTDCDELKRELGGALDLVDQARENHVTPFGAVQKFSYCFFRKGSGPQTFRTSPA